MRKAGALFIGSLAITAALLAGGGIVQAQSPEDGATSALIVTKLCPAGTGSSAASFNVLVAQNGAGLAADVLACDEALVVPGLMPGIYNVSELITGLDAANFSTTIACATAADPFVTPGNSADVAVEAGVDAQCAVVNLFMPPPPAAAPEEDPTQDGTNNSTHTTSNFTRTTGNGLDNRNYESNSNTTSNTQHDDSSGQQNNGNVE